MIKPVRVQRSRQRKVVSPNSLSIKYVGRPSIWGNPYEGVGAVKKFEKLVMSGKWHSLDKIRKELKNRNLSCWCMLQDKNGNKVSCHSEILLRIANENGKIKGKDAEKKK